MDRRLKYTNITAAGTNVLKTGVGNLVMITVNKPVSGSTITLYDNTAASGTKIGTITNSTVTTPYFLKYDCFFSTGARR